jgi:hypothetical protein
VSEVIDRTDFIEAKDVQANDVVRAQNEKSRFNRHSDGDVCWLCLKGMSAKAFENAWHIHMTIFHELVPMAKSDSLPADIDQGMFPIGAECAKKIPRTHKTKMENRRS